MTVQISEVLRRATQGVTRPFICRGEDGHIYFVKGRGAGRRGQICEWVAGNLALKLGLPIAPFTVVEVPEALLELVAREDRHELGAGPAFGSRRLSVVELTRLHLEHIPDDIQRDVLAFDWWVRNGDRNLSDAGGNPNLFWNMEDDSLVVIDHNQAFDAQFSAADFVDLHVFHEQSPALFEDWVIQQSYCTRFAEAMTGWAAICDTVPPEWWFLDDEQTVPTDFDVEGARQLLMRYQDDGFWNVK